MIVAPLWSWPAALVLLMLGITTGWLLLPFLWPMRRELGLKLPVVMLGALALLVPSVFYLFLSALRAAEDRATPSTTWVQWLVYAAGLTVGLWLEERRHG